MLPLKSVESVPVHDCEAARDVPALEQNIVGMDVEVSPEAAAVPESDEGGPHEAEAALPGVGGGSGVADDAASSAGSDSSDSNSASSRGSSSSSSSSSSTSSSSSDGGGGGDDAAVPAAGPLSQGSSRWVLTAHLGHLRSHGAYTILALAKPEGLNFKPCALKALILQ